jgi:hypothetical protein
MKYKKIIPQLDKPTVQFCEILALPLDNLEDQTLKYYNSRYQKRKNATIYTHHNRASL